MTGSCTVIVSSGVLYRNDVAALLVGDGVTPDVVLTGEVRRLLSPVPGFLVVDPAGANNSIRFIAKAVGAIGNKATVTYTDPGGVDKALSLVLTRGVELEVILDQNGAGAVTTTADQLIAAIKADRAVSAIFSVFKLSGASGAGAVASVATQHLGGGAEIGLVATSAFLAGDSDDIVTLVDSEDTWLSDDSDSAKLVMVTPREARTYPRRGSNNIRATDPTDPALPLSYTDAVRLSEAIAMADGELLEPGSTIKMRAETFKRLIRGANTSPESFE